MLLGISWLEMTMSRSQTLSWLCKNAVMVVVIFKPHSQTSIRLVVEVNLGWMDAFIHYSSPSVYRPVLSIICTSTQSISVKVRTAITLFWCILIHWTGSVDVVVTFWSKGWVSRIGVSTSFLTAAVQSLVLIINHRDASFKARMRCLGHFQHRSAALLR